MVLMSNKTFIVEYLLVVDRPQLRSPGMTRPAPGTRQMQHFYCDSQAAAVRYFESILCGEYDFRSEYVAKVAVYQKRENSAHRIVRKRVERVVDRSDYACGVDKLSWLCAGIAAQGRRMVRMNVSWAVG
jgi:hypothetical protein